MLIPAYVYLRCEKCGADHGREHLPLMIQAGQVGWYETNYTPGDYAISKGTWHPEKCLACGELTVRTFFETNEFRGE